MSTDENLQEEMKYVMRCIECSCTEFNALKTGHISCCECGLTYTYIAYEPIKDWVFTVMDTSDRIRKEQQKEWDEDVKEFIPIEELQQKKDAKRLKKIEKKKEKKRKDNEDKQ